MKSDKEASGCESILNRPPDVEAIFKFNGVRMRPVWDRYRPAHLVTEDYLTTGIHHYYGTESVPPDGTAKGTITFITPEAYPRCLWIGKKINIQEGGRVVGTAMITDIYNPLLRAETADVPEMREMLSLAARKWKLSNIKPIYESSERSVYMAEAEDLGAVIVKAGLRKEELCREYRALLDMEGQHTCKVYVYDDCLGVLIEERILPGNVLREEPNIEQRIKAFTEAFGSIHKAPKQQIYDTYLDWLKRADAFCGREDASVTPALAEKMHAAKKIGAEMFEKYPDRVLLHGDLHHDNMLKNHNGGYTVIDPKGVIGPSVFDLPRFLMNEFGYVDEADDEAAEQHIRDAILLLGGQTGFPAADIAKLLFMEVMLGNIWRVEDHETPDLREIVIVERLANKIRKTS